MNIETRRQKQQALIAELLERKIRLHAQQLYDRRGRTDGFALEDWVQAESEVLGNSILAPLYRKTRVEEGAAPNDPDASQFASNSSDSSVSEACS